MNSGKIKNMVRKIWVWIQDRYRRVINSIAFYPVLIVLGFLVLSGLMITFDFSEKGKEIKSGMHWLSLKDASTARSIVTSIVAGIISLAVFSFSMVMIVLNQAASQMSNRVLDKLIGNNFQQVVLGIYIGTIVYALFLLSTIRDIDSGLYIPALSTYLLIVITIFDIFLFIYFLHYITQSVKYEVVIERIYDDTKKAMHRSCCLDKEPEAAEPFESVQVLRTKTPGIYEGFNKSALLELCEAHDCKINMLHPPGTFLLNGKPVASLNKELPEKARESIMVTLNFPVSESIDENYLYGFRQLSEVAIKALSPGINDPGTAVVSLRFLFQLLAYRICYYPDFVIYDDEGKPRINTREKTFDEVFRGTILPIWDHGKNDRLFCTAMKEMLTQLQDIKNNAMVARLLQQVHYEE